jgi:hypothetical protein
MSEDDDKREDRLIGKILFWVLLVTLSACGLVIYVIEAIMKGQR